MSFITRYYSNSQLTNPTDKQNYRNVQVDAVGVALANAAAFFLPVFLQELSASNFQVGLLTSMPAFTGLLLAIPLGRFLQSKANVVPWFSTARLMVILCYALSGLVTMIVPAQWRVMAVLAIWAIATLPQTIVSITFSVVMNAVAGPKGRFDLMSQRWSIMGLTTSMVVFLIGQLLIVVKFPINYQVVFMALSLGGLISFYFSSHIRLPNQAITNEGKRFSLIDQYRQYGHIIRTEKPFISFITKRFVFLTGTALTLPLFPIYFVQVAHLKENWIGGINTAQTFVMIIGYFFWAQQSRHRGSRRVLLWTTLGLSLYPAIVALTQHAWMIVLVAGLSGIFQAGLDLVFFDELMNTIPPEFSATFVSFAQSVQYLSTIVFPLIGTFLGDAIGVGPALAIAGGVRLAGFLMFYFGKPVKRYAGLEEPATQKPFTTTPDHATESSKIISNYSAGER